MPLRVAAAQLAVTADIASNAAAINDAIDFAQQNNADILLTPEGSLSGYTHQFDTQHAEAALQQVTTKAKAAGIGLALGTCFVEADDGKCYNQLRFYDKSGDYLGFHSKILRTGSMTDPTQGEVNHYATRPLETYDFHGTTIGGLICNDMWANPACTPMPDTHLTQQLSKRGAQVILHAVNGGRGRGDWSDVNWAFHSSNLRMRAKAGSIWIVTVDSSEPVDVRCSAPSGVLNPAGDWVCKANDTGVDCFTYDIPV